MSALSPAELWGRVESPLSVSELRVRVERCACGGWIKANADDPGPAVLRHNRTDEHRAWWLRISAR